MQVVRLWLSEFRSYRELELDLDLGLTAIIGANGMGKTNLLEALGVLASLKSFRGAPTESVIRKGADAAIVRAEGFRDGRDVLIELELGRGRTRAQVNRQRLRRSRDLLGALRITVFAPDDLSLLKEGPAVRREYLDDVLVALDPAADATFRQFERVLKQRNALLKQSHGRLDDAALITLDVWDAKLAEVGTEVTRRREQLVERLLPLVQDAYSTLVSASGDSRDKIGVSYVRSWPGLSLARALTEARDSDVRRGVTTVGPHRDELAITLNGMASRTEASQGEQRTLALAMRLASHCLLTDAIGEPPLLLLDDVLSELDVARADALLANLPPGQTIITSATELPDSISPDRLLRFDPATGDLMEDRP